MMVFTTVTDASKPNALPSSVVSTDDVATPGLEIVTPE
jgi:hypothetical protein